MTDWSIDMGFDQNAVLNQDAAGNQVAFLQWGAVNLSTQPPTQTDLNDVKTGDTIQFNLYDVTGLNNGTNVPSDGKPSLTAPAADWKGPWQWITIEPADPNTSGTPFAPSTFSTLQSNPSLNSVGWGTSTVFSPPTSSGAAQTYPKWQVIAGGQQEQKVTVASLAASYLYTIRLWVQFQDGPTKVFEVDPEMVVNPG